jgi:hypothetical protein
MNAALQVAVGPKLEAVGGVHNDASRGWLDVLPVPDRLRKHERQAAKIGVAAQVHLLKFGVLAIAAIAVSHVTKEGFTGFVVRVSGSQGVLGNLQNDSDELEQLEDDLLVDVAMEYFDFGVVLLHDRRVLSLVSVGELEDVVKLNIVVKAGKNLNGPERPIAVVAAVFQVRSMLQLLSFGKVEDLLSNGKLPVYLLRSQADVGDVEEPNLLDCFV